MTIAVERKIDHTNIIENPEEAIIVETTAGIALPLKVVALLLLVLLSSIKEVHHTKEKIKDTITKE